MFDEDAQLVLDLEEGANPRTTEVLHGHLIVDLESLSNNLVSVADCCVRASHHKLALFGIGLVSCWHDDLEPFFDLLVRTTALLLDFLDDLFPVLPIAIDSVLVPHFAIELELEGFYWLVAL